MHNYTPKLNKRDDARKYKCGLVECLNFLLRDDLLAHLRKEHPASLIEEAENIESWNMVNTWGGKYYLCYGELFKRYILRGSDGQLHFLLQLYGLDKVVKHYKYEIHLLDETSSSKMLKVTGRCDKYEDKRYMVTINAERAKPFIINNKVKYTTKIMLVPPEELNH